MEGKKKGIVERIDSMANNRTKTIAGAAAALGLSAAYLWLRDFIQFVRSGGSEQQRQAYIQRRMQQARINSTQPIPATSGPGASAAASPVGTETGPSLVLKQQSDLLVQYLLSFHSMVDLTRSRRKENGSGWKTSVSATSDLARQYSSLTEKDRESFRLTLDRLQEQLPGYSKEELKPNSIQQRMFILIMKIHDTMHNPALGDDDLFRVYGEVTEEACPLLDEAKEREGASGSDYRYARTLYECD
jgi:hypothetical protein